jgi:glucose-1-phosphate adenylyltransferase
MDLVHVTPALDLYDKSWPIWTCQEQLPPAKFVFDDDERRGVAADSLVSGGCIISGSTVRRSLLFSNVRVHSYCQIEDAVILPDVEIGRGAKLRRVVVDNGTRIPAGLEVGCDREADARRFFVSEKGVTVITNDMLAAGVRRL